MQLLLLLRFVDVVGLVVGVAGSHVVVVGGGVGVVVVVVAVVVAVVVVVVVGGGVIVVVVVLCVCLVGRLVGVGWLVCLLVGCLVVWLLG